MGFFGDTLRKPLEKQGIPYHLAVTLIQNELQKSVCLVLHFFAENDESTSHTEYRANLQAVSSILNGLC